jgi:signal transduction histidine kinase
VGNFRDVTARKAAEAEREAFADAAAHDLKTPLTALRGQAQLLLRRARAGRLGDGAVLEAGLATIDAAVGRMVALIDELMDAAHLRAGRSLELNLVPADLAALAGEAAAEAAQGAPGHTVRVEANEPGVVGVWDGARLRRVLGNLLGNAVKYSPGGGAVRVRVGREADAAGEWAVVAVSDEGLGIPEEDLPRVFERFHRGGNVGRIGGTGIGLFGARRIVEQHGGTVEVASDEGRGSTFTVRLPLGPSGDRGEREAD